MKVESLIDIIGADFYAGVPDSQLKALCNYLMNTYGIDAQHHIIAANEGNATALAAGYHLATGKVPVVYMQNSGEGNVINPVASLMNDKVYGLPCIFVIGWRGEPGIHDEPQHIYQGEVTLRLLEDMDIAYHVITTESKRTEVNGVMEAFGKLLSTGKQVAFVVRKGALTYDGKVLYKNDNLMKREEIIKHITAVSGDDIIVSTTGKASRELFQIRAGAGETHARDFLTVGSMGHTSSIAMEIAVQKPDRKVWCIDGDGAVLMHMGAMAITGANKPSNLIHVIINNGAHETVGGQPTVAPQINFAQIAEGCGYERVYAVSTFAELDRVLSIIKVADKLTLIEVKSAIGARDDLGRPTTTAKENKEGFMKYLK